MPNRDDEHPAPMDPGLIEVERHLRHSRAAAFGLVKTAAVIIVISAIITFAVSSAGLLQ